MRRSRGGLPEALEPRRRLSSGVVGPESGGLGKRERAKLLRRVKREDDRLTR